MKRPSFQFYPGDWLGDTKLRRCSHAARGAWIDVLCVLHDSEEYGVARFPLAELASASGAPIKLLKELIEKGVLKGCDKGECEPFVYTPRSGRKVGAPVTLVAPIQGPIWYSSRMVRDEYVRTHRGGDTRFKADPLPDEWGDPDAAPNAAPNPRIGERQGDGSSTSPSSSASLNTAAPVDSGRAPRAPAPTRDLEAECFVEGQSAADLAGSFEGEPDDEAEAEAAANRQPPAERFDTSGQGPTPYGAICMAIKRAGFGQPAPGDMAFKALVDAGVTQDEFVDAAKKAATQGKPWKWLLGAVRGARDDAARMVAGLPGQPAAPGRGNGRPFNRQEAIEANNRRAGAEWLRQQEQADASQ